MVFSQEEVEAHLGRLEGWELEEGRWIVRKFVFSNYMKGIAFVDEVAAISEAFNHHPFITIDYTTAHVSRHGMTEVLHL